MTEFAAVLTDASDDEPCQRCGISRDKLEKDFVKLPCGHCFNYLDYLRYAVTLSAQRQQCPYCRHPNHKKIFKIDELASQVPGSCKHVSSRNHGNHRECGYIFSRGKMKDSPCGAMSARDTEVGPRCAKHSRRK